MLGGTDAKRSTPQNASRGEPSNISLRMARISAVWFGQSLLQIGQ